MTHEEWVDNALRKFKEQEEAESSQQSQKKEHRRSAAFELYWAAWSFRAEAQRSTINNTTYTKAWDDLLKAIDRFEKAHSA